MEENAEVLEEKPVKSRKTKSKKQFTFSKKSSTNTNIEKVKKEIPPFRPKTFKEMWDYVEKGIKDSCFNSNTGLFNKDLYNKKKKDLKPILKDLWYSNAEKRERFFESERQMEAIRKGV